MTLEVQGPAIIPKSLKGAPWQSHRDFLAIIDIDEVRVTAVLSVSYTSSNEKVAERPK